MVFLLLIPLNINTTTTMRNYHYINHELSTEFTFEGRTYFASCEVEWKVVTEESAGDYWTPGDFSWEVLTTKFTDIYISDMDGEDVVMTSQAEAIIKAAKIALSIESSKVEGYTIESEITA